jgi:F-type H+-transporting ATPase subunit a
MPLAAIGSSLVPEEVIMTWAVMGLLIALAGVVKFQIGRRGVGRFQNVFELFMESLCSLIREIVRADPSPYVPLAGTLFLFVFASNLWGMIPGMSSPTADISVTAALAVIVFLAVPFYGIRSKGLVDYLKVYIQPTPFLLPLNILSELTRTLALAVRLFGNIMSGQLLFVIVAGVVTTVMKGYARVFMPAGFVLTLFISVLSLITAVIQAYIFTVLALVYIGAAVERRAPQGKKAPSETQEEATT